MSPAVKKESTSRRKVLRRLTLTHEQDSRIKLNGRTLEDYNYEWNGSEPLLKRVRRRMIALAEDGLDEHLRKYNENPTRVESDYLGRGRYHVFSTDENNTNEFDRSFT